MCSLCAKFLDQAVQLRSPSIEQKIRISCKGGVLISILMLTTSASYDCVSFYLFYPGIRSRILLFLGMVARLNQLIPHRYRCCCCCCYYCLCTTQLRILLFAPFPIASPRNLGVGSVLLFSQPRPWAVWRRDDGTRIWRLSRLNSTGLTKLLILKTIFFPSQMQRLALLQMGCTGIPTVARFMGWLVLR